MTESIETKVQSLQAWLLSDEEHSLSYLEYSLASTAVAELRDIFYAKDMFGSTLLHTLARIKNKNKYIAVLNKAIEIGIDFSDSAFVDLVGNTPLHLAVEAEHRTLVKKMLEQASMRSAWLNAKNYRGHSPTYIATEIEHLDILTLLLNQRECELTQRDNNQQNLLVLAANKRNKDILYAILEQHRHNAKRNSTQTFTIDELAVCLKQRIGFFEAQHSILNKSSAILSILCPTAAILTLGFAPIVSFIIGCSAFFVFWQTNYSQDTAAYGHEAMQTEQLIIANSMIARDRAELVAFNKHIPTHTYDTQSYAENRGVLRDIALRQIRIKGINNHYTADRKRQTAVSKEHLASNKEKAITWLNMLAMFLCTFSAIADIAAYLGPLIFKTIIGTTLLSATATISPFLGVGLLLLTIASIAGLITYVICAKHKQAALTAFGEQRDKKIHQSHKIANKLSPMVRDITATYNALNKKAGPAILEHYKQQWVKPKPQPHSQSLFARICGFFKRPIPTATVNTTATPVAPPSAHHSSRRCINTTAA